MALTIPTDVPTGANSLTAGYLDGHETLSMGGVGGIREASLDSGKYSNTIVLQTGRKTAHFDMMAIINL